MLENDKKNLAPRPSLRLVKGSSQVALRVVWRGVAPLETGPAAIGTKSYAEALRFLEDLRLDELAD